VALGQGWLEDHEVEGAPRAVKDITTTLTEQSENISVLQRTVVADAHGGISSKWFSGGGSFVMFRNWGGSRTAVGCPEGHWGAPGHLGRLLFASDGGNSHDIRDQNQDSIGTSSDFEAL